jgi:preprotein translocase subunit SecB
MQPSKMQLEQYFVDEASFRLRDSALQKLKGDPVLESGDMDIEVHLGENKEDPFKRFCQLNIKLKEAAARRFPYAFKVVMVGFFNLDTECTTEDTDLLMTNAAPSMLYTAGREYLLTMTGRSRYLPIMLPTVLFVPKQKSASARARPGAKPAARKPRTTRPAKI